MWTPLGLRKCPDYRGVRISGGTNKLSDNFKVLLNVVDSTSQEWRGPTMILCAPYMHGDRCTLEAGTVEPNSAELIHSGQVVGYTITILVIELLLYHV